MQTFRFRLAKVLEWYRRQLEEQERRLAVCLAALAEAQKAIERLQAERVAIERDVVSRPAIPSRDFVALGLYRLGAKKREVELEAAREQRAAEVREQQAAVRAADRRVRLIEKLRERRMTEYAYAETKELEELASDAFFAKWAAR